MKSGVINAMPLPVKLVSDYNLSDFVFNITRRGKTLDNVTLNSNILKFGDIISYTASQNFTPKNTTYNGGTPAGFIGSPIHNSYRVNAYDKIILADFNEIPFYNINTSGTINGSVSLKKSDNTIINNSTKIFIGDDIKLTYTKPSGSFNTLKLIDPVNNIIDYIYSGKTITSTILNTFTPTAESGYLTFSVSENTETATITTQSGLKEITQNGNTNTNSSPATVSANVPVNIYMKTKNNSTYLQKIVRSGTSSETNEYIFDESPDDSQTTTMTFTPIANGSYTITPTYVSTKVSYPTAVMSNFYQFTGNTQTFVSSGNTYIPYTPLYYTIKCSYNNRRLKELSYSGNSIPTTYIINNFVSTNSDITNYIRLNKADSAVKFTAKYMDPNTIICTETEGYPSSSSTFSSGTLYFLDFYAPYNSTVTISYTIKYLVDGVSKTLTGTKTMTAPSGQNKYTTKSLDNLYQLTARCGTQYVATVRSNLSVSWTCPNSNTLGPTYMEITASVGDTTIDTYTV